MWYSAHVFSVADPSEDSNSVLGIYLSSVNSVLWASFPSFVNSVLGIYLGMDF